MEATNVQVVPSHAKGLAIGFFGVLTLSPDALLIRLISVDGWTLVFWRGLLMSLTLLLGIALSVGIEMTHSHGPGTLPHSDSPKPVEIPTAPETPQ